MLKPLLIYVIAFVLAALRVAGHKSEAFQAVAHLFVGGLFAAGWVEYGFTWTGIKCDGGKSAMRKIWLGVALSLVEVGCFLWFKFAG
jgi:FtsH-binding integral membrane protein